MPRPSAVVTPGPGIVLSKTPGIDVFLRDVRQNRDAVPLDRSVVGIVVIAVPSVWITAIRWIVVMPTQRVTMLAMPAILVNMTPAVEDQASCPRPGQVCSKT